jgi:hypothetical protein
MDSEYHKSVEKRVDTTAEVIESEKVGKESYDWIKNESRDSDTLQNSRGFRRKQLISLVSLTVTELHLYLMKPESI